MKIAEFIIEQKVDEKWSAKYKRSIDCSNPKGFSQRAHCQGRKKNNESIINEFAPGDDRDGGGDFDEEILRKLAAQWWNGNEQQMTRAQKTLASMGWDIGEDDGYDDGGVFVIRIGDEDGRSYISWPHEDLQLSEDSMSLRDWFGKGKHGGAGGGGWDRYNTKGERIGKCGDRKPSEGKPKCLSKSKAASLRASGGKAAIAAAVNKKRREDPNPERRGRADMVSNTTRKKNNESVQVQEKAKSRQQQKYFAMVHALQKGEEIPGASAKLKQTAASMSKSDVADFAKTKHSGLPTKVKKK